MGEQQEVLFAEVRKQNIVEMVNGKGRATVAELCKEFNVSSATIRNDLRELEEAGALKRTHGGAINKRRVSYELNTYEKEVQNVNRKRAIALSAVGYVHPGDSIAIDTGTTTFELAKLLGSIADLTVVTNDLQIAAYLERNTNAYIIMAGGAVRRHFHCTVGDSAINTVKNLHVDKVFIAANGVHIKKGLTTPNMDMASIKMQLIECADEVFVLADSSKINTSAFISFAPLSRVDVLIMDDEADPMYLKEIKAMGVDVITAEIKK
ncbi:MAG: DeoR/GlpR family DNA-binding transcription regulator [Eubacteriales bacterium]|nr:DeoR/GlpR family DNA-binding transcription regulator [Eubacteriales bacterium]